MDTKTKWNTFPIKHITLTLFSLLCLIWAHGQKIERSDLEHFWEAYDKITSTQNDSLQRHYLDALFLSQASEGQKILMRKVWGFQTEQHPQRHQAISFILAMF